MAWNAKPSGGYSITSKEGGENIAQMNSILHEEGFTLEAQSGVLGNCFAESGLNPWRWQSDNVNMSNGYGLFQFTPARGYIDDAKEFDGYAPNLSVSTVTSGASPSDGYAQTYVMVQDFLGKWNPYIWRSYWDKNEYADLWYDVGVILEAYGTDGKLTINGYRKIDGIYYATLAFLGCYEGPAVPNIDTRVGYARQIYELLSGEPAPPDPPHGGKKKSMPLWLYLRKF